MCELVCVRVRVVWLHSCGDVCACEDVEWVAGGGHSGNVDVKSKLHGSGWEWV